MSFGLRAKTTQQIRLGWRIPQILCASHKIIQDSRMPWARGERTQNRLMVGKQSESVAVRIRFLEDVKNNPAQQDSRHPQVPVKPRDGIASPPMLAAYTHLRPSR